MASGGSRKPGRDTRVGIGAVGSIGVVLLTGLLISSTLLLGSAVLEFWPPECPAAGVLAPAPTATPAASLPPATPSVTTAPGESTSTSSCPQGSEFARTEFSFWGHSVTLNREQNLLMLVVLLGALGAMGHVLRSFFKYVGERKLVWSWVVSYLLTPFVGSIIAVLTYIILRAGLLGTTGGGAVVGNTWGFAAVAALVGLFSAQAASKLKQVFETLFAPSEPGGESLDQEVELRITEFTPASATIGEKVELLGDGLENARVVRFAGNVESPASYDDKAALLRTVVPQGATGGPLTVIVGNETATSAQSLTIT